MDDICMCVSGTVCVFGYEMEYKGADIPTEQIYLEKKLICYKQHHYSFSYRITFSFVCFL